MQFISRTAHGALDYIVGVLFLFLPMLLGLTGRPAHVFVALGVATLVYSVCTNYELGVFPILPFTVHRALDVLNGLLLLFSPWLFGFAGQVRAPHVVLGVFELVVVALTRRAPAARVAGAPGAPAHF